MQQYFSVLIWIDWILGWIIKKCKTTQPMMFSCLNLQSPIHLAMRQNNHTQRLFKHPIWRTWPASRPRQPITIELSRIAANQSRGAGGPPSGKVFETSLSLSESSLTQVSWTKTTGRDFGGLSKEAVYPNFKHYTLHGDVRSGRRIGLAVGVINSRQEDLMVPFPVQKKTSFVSLMLWYSHFFSK